MIEGLDKYLTNGPDFSFDDWCEQVTDSLSQSFFEANEDWILDNDGICNLWLQKLEHKSPKEAAAIIERAHKRYIR